MLLGFSGNMKLRFSILLPFLIGTLILSGGFTYWASNQQGVVERSASWENVSKGVEIEPYHRGNLLVYESDEVILGEPNEIKENRKLFSVNEESEFNGNYNIRIYLTNTGEISEYFRYLILEIGVRDDEDDYFKKYLTLENGNVEFNGIESGNFNGESTDIIILNGSYILREETDKDLEFAGEIEEISD